jgi:hypothetical protein
MSSKSCFVVMGYGVKTDYVTGRKLDLDKTYRVLIKPVVKQRNINCIRADEIKEAGSIDLKMYQQLLQADLVIADLSTANPNALYELGVRHALRPFSTIVIAEDKLVYPFNLNHTKIAKYTHLGSVIDAEEADRFKAYLGNMIDNALQKMEADSPVYTYLRSLTPPKLGEAIAQVATADDQPAGSPKAEGQALSFMIEQGEKAIAAQQFGLARRFFESATDISVQNESQADSYLIQRLAFCLYKSAEPTVIASLYKAVALLDEINLAHSNDPETVATAGTLKKKLYEAGEGIEHLEDAILYFQRSYYLLNNRYHGINLAICCVYQATSDQDKSNEERIADLVIAKRTWQRVLFLCDRDEAEISPKQDTRGPACPSEEALELTDYFYKQQFWMAVNRAEANFGLGNFEAYEKAVQDAKKIPHAHWMWESFDSQLQKLRARLPEWGHLMNPAWSLPDY